MKQPGLDLRKIEQRPNLGELINIVLDAKYCETLLRICSFGFD